MLFLENLVRFALRLLIQILNALQESTLVIIGKAVQYRIYTVLLFIYLADNEQIFVGECNIPNVAFLFLKFERNVSVWV